MVTAARNPTPHQLFADLDSVKDAALRESILLWGVVVPVVRDQHGRTIDGHQRARIADELGVGYRVDVRVVESDEEARELALTLNADRRQLPADQRREIAQALRGSGHSLRAIGGALGVGVGTVHRDVATVPGGTVPVRVTGLDGKSRPAKRTVVAAKSKREAERAQAALADASELPGTVVDVRRMELIAREQQAARRRTEPVAASRRHGEVEVRLGDLRSSVLDDLAGQVDAIITDPPYPKQYDDVYTALAELAARLLRPNGTLVVLCGTRPSAWLRRLPGMEAHLPLRWVGSYLTPGASYRNHQAGIATNWKPLLIFGGDRNLNTDVFRSSGDDKQHHRWGQNEDAFASIVSAFSDPGDLVVDPFLGGGTTAVVCRDLGRRFVGCDTDQAAISTTNARVAKQP